MPIMKHNVVALDGWVKLKPLDFDHDFVQYDLTSPDQCPDRIKDATIVISANQKVTREAINAAPHLQLINCNGTGTDHVDKDAARERGITVTHVPAQNTESVAEHAFALYFSLRRRIPQAHEYTIAGDVWPVGGLMLKKLGKPTRTNSEETLVVVGYGALGKHVEKTAKALGMKVLIAERRGASEVRPDRTPFDVAIKTGTVFIFVAPLDEHTRNMIGQTEFEAMDPTALVVNVGRGGVINEQALVDALRNGQIGGAATDVFETEPATKENSPLIDPSVPNLILSPHIAWYSNKTIVNTLEIIKVNIENFVAGKPINVVVAGK